MRPEQLRIGVVDSGVPEPRAGYDAAFVIRDAALWQAEADPDHLGHGTRVAEVIHHMLPEAEIFSAQVFMERLATTATQVAAAIDWLVEQEVNLINLSLGLRYDRAPLRDACHRALKRGVLVSASAPARGDAVYPSAYPGVFRMTGDARCGRDEIAHLETAFADFGGCVLPVDENRDYSGASLGCAHMSGHLGRYLIQTDRPRLSAARAWLIEQAVYQGPERRGADER
ncbi:subtilisin-like serine protease QhpE [Marinobacterium sp. YM272]|uniref:subtilisin-like serine protease QhpE n=1 Tax=Marinobacterium sp. YM272 TaxID=3421654 RepID=UPI003D7FC642